MPSSVGGDRLRQHAVWVRRQAGELLTGRHQPLRVPFVLKDHDDCHERETLLDPDQAVAGTAGSHDHLGADADHLPADVSRVLAWDDAGATLHLANVPVGVSVVTGVLDWVDPASPPSSRRIRSAQALGQDDLRPPRLAYCARLPLIDDGDPVSR